MNDSWGWQGYPEINWEDLPTRFRKHYPDLDKILHGKSSSFYRDSFEATIKEGKSRTLGQAMTDDLQALSPGYYGARGARIMLDHIISRFAPQIRKLAVLDKTISSRGVTGYVQAVLVPELAVRLIKTDLCIDEEKARSIMKESVSLGDLLNSEDDDEIRR